MNLLRYGWLLVAVMAFLPCRAGRNEDQRAMLKLLHEACVKGRRALADIKEYDARLYVRCRMNVNRRNVLMNLVPSMFKFQSGRNAYIAETNNELHYTAPNIYDRKINEITGTFANLQTQPDIFSDYFYINIYATTLLEDRLLSPLAIENKSYYRYKLDDYASTDREFHILIIPRHRNTQLVRGEVCLDRHSGTIRRINISGQYDLLNFSLNITMGEEGAAAFLPVRYNGEIDFKFAGNSLSANYLAALDYENIVNGYVNEEKHIRKKLDLTTSYRLSTEHTRFLKSPWEFGDYRCVPLSSADSLIYRQAEHYNDSTGRAVTPLKRNKFLWGQVGELILKSHKFKMGNTAAIKVSPIINPVLLSYNSAYGYSYRVDFPLQLQIRNGQSFELFPRIGYNFTEKQFYWRVTSTLNYLPRKQGNLILTLGNGERIYNSSVLDRLKSLTRDQINFNKMNLNYFNDSFLDLSNRIELFNGFRLTTGIIYHKRTPYARPDIPPDITPLPRRYISFAPHVRLEYTPRQYYYYDNYNKVNTKSAYPTFSVDWERGLKNTVKSTITYERLEFEINYKLRIKSLRSFSSRLGYGFFTQQPDIFFVDYANFSRYSIPYGWEDEMGGIFHLLDRRWYNASTNYLRANIVYESPMLLLTRIPGLPRYIQQERLYLNFLRMNNLHFYCEAGYGFATHIFDVGAFVSNINGKFNSFGCKFTFELFRK